MKLSIVIAVLVTGAACTACTRSAAGGVLRPAARLAEPRASHSATALPDGTLLVAGGFRKAADGVSQQYAATTEIVDPVAGTVKAGPALATARAGHSATTLGDGRVLLAGGWNAGGVLRSAELFDPATGTVTAVVAELRSEEHTSELQSQSNLVC